MKWLQVDNHDGTQTLKQHCYIHKVCKVPYTREQYAGNVSLCDRSSVINEDELRISYDYLDSEPLSEKEACKICLRRYNDQLILLEQTKEI